MYSILCLFIFIVVPLYGQSLPSIDELRQLETKARGKNISLENFEDLINKNNDGPTFQNSSITEKEDLLKNIKNQQEKDKTINELDIKNETSKDTEVVENEKKINNVDSTYIKQSNEYFGYDVFDIDPSVFQPSYDDVIDPNYIIGPGDDVIIMLWGETELTENYTVSKEGYLFIDNIGQVFVNGLNLENLEKKLFRLLKKVYSSLDDSNKNSTSYFDVSLGSNVIRPIRVFALGEVSKAGAYNIKSSSDLFSSLFYFGGPTIKGSLRDIRLIRNNKEIASIDFYDYLLTGKQKGNVRVQRDDVIFIPNRLKTVKVFGEVNRPGIYELLDNESLNDLINIFGNLKATSYTKRVQIKRILPPNERERIGIDRKLIDLDLSLILKNQDEIELFDGDELTFFEIFDVVSNVVSINGQIKRPGEYQLTPKMTIKDLIKKADGLLPDVYEQRANLIRLNYADNTPVYIDIDLSKALKGDTTNNILLSPGDNVELLKKSSMLFQTDISILGHVKNPGVKQFKTEMELIDLIWLGGGFEDKMHLSETYLEKAEIIRFNVEKKEYESEYFNLASVLAGEGIYNLKIKMGDEVRIYSKSEIFGNLNSNVTIRGFVKRPGEYVFHKGMKLSDLLFKAGGGMDPSHKADMYLKRADIVRKDFSSNSSYIINYNLADLYDSLKNKDMLLQKGDLVRIYSSEMFKINDEVTIDGNIEKPGTYEYKNGMTLKDIILEGGGVKNGIINCRIDVASLDEKNTNLNFYANVKSFYFDNIEDTFLNESNNQINHKIKPGDNIIIRNNPFILKQVPVSLEGAVYYPGNYFLQGPNENVKDLIERAGGLTPDAYPNASIFIRNNESINLDFENLIKRKRSKDHFFLQAGDSIIISFKPNLIKIIGEVSSPGNYRFFKDKTINDYIKISGGLTESASRTNIYIRYPNGTSKKNKIYSLSPKVIDGSTIIVSKKEETDFNFTQYATNLTQIWADITQAYFMILVAVRSI